MEKKILVTGKELAIELEDIFNGTSPEEAIDSIVRICNGLEGEQHKFRIVYDYDDIDIYLTSYRYETDKEYERRMKNEEKAKIQKEKLKVKREESERKMFEQLKKKYDKK